MQNGPSVLAPFVHPLSPTSHKKESHQQNKARAVKEGGAFS